MTSNIGLISIIQQNFLVLALSFLLGASGAYLISRYAGKLGLIDQPNNRSSHNIPTPKGGGIGITITLALVATAYAIPFFFWLPIIILSLVSLFGDKSHISPFIRLFLQFFAAVIVLVSLLTISSPTDLLLFRGNGWLAKILFIVSGSLFLVASANFYNFMDGINGIAAISSIIGFSLLAAYGQSNGIAPDMIIICLCIAAACLGFLPFNFPKARVFMGDTGSVLLGFLFASMILAFSQDLQDITLMTGFMFPLFADELITMVERIIERQDLTKPHRQHLYQVLANEAGIDHWKVALAYSVVQLGAALLFWKALTINATALTCSMVGLGILFYTVNNILKEKFLQKTLM